MARLPSFVPLAMVAVLIRSLPVLYRSFNSLDLLDVMCAFPLRIHFAATWLIYSQSLMPSSKLACSALVCLILSASLHLARLNNLSVSVLNVIHRLALSSMVTMILAAPLPILSLHWKRAQIALMLP